MDGEELKTFVSGRSGAHPNGTLAKGDGTTYTGYGSLRRDGFASLVVSGEAPAVITTRPLIWQVPRHSKVARPNYCISDGAVLTGRTGRLTSL